MSLTLTILSGTRPGGTAGPGTARRQITHGTFGIGRAAGNDWMLPDPERHLSKRHCVISFRDSFWEVTDLSTNGTFLNRDPAPIGHMAVRDLRDGDRLRVGSYEIAVAIADDLPDARRTAPSSALDPLSLSLPGPSSSALDPVSVSLPSPSSLSNRRATPLQLSILPQPVLDPLSLHGPAFSSPPTNSDPFDLPVQSDHTPGVEDAFSPPKPVVLLGEDWDLGNSQAPEPLPERNLKPDLSPVPVPAASAVVEADASDLMAAFLRGAGMTDARPADPAAAMEALGASFRAMVGGLRETLATRAAVKSEFRIGQTMIRARGNNPLKFSANDDDALLALVGAGRRTDIGPAEAVTEAFHDIRLHELATMAAMQSAVRGMLHSLAPAKLREQAEQSGGLNLVPSQRKVRAWEAFELAHGRLTQALSDNFDSVFGRAFARAYEQASREVGHDGAAS
jgi:type VI secretion system FHA domain protein